MTFAKIQKKVPKKLIQHKNLLAEIIPFSIWLLYAKVLPSFKQLFFSCKIYTFQKVPLPIYLTLKSTYKKLYESKVMELRFLKLWNSVEGNQIINMLVKSAFINAVSHYYCSSDC